MAVAHHSIKVYQNILGSENAFSLFHQPWWLDATCGPGNWRVAVSLNEDTGEVEGLLPYCIRARYGLKIIAPPPLTPFLGPLLFPREEWNRYKRRSFEEKVIGRLATQLPDLPIIRLKLQYEMWNWLPFRWAGYKQTTLYSYRIKNLDDVGRIWSDFHSKLRNEINYASRCCEVRQVDDAELVFRLFEGRFQRKGKKKTFSWNWFAGIDQALTQRQARALFVCYASGDNPIAGAYIAWDTRSAYLLLTGFDEDENVRGATALAIWSSIQFVSGKGLSYDFEGSMLPGVERFFRDFGGDLCPYHYLVKYRNKGWALLDGLIR